MSTLVGAYVCPRGVYALECGMTRAGLEVRRTFEAPAMIVSPAAAVDQLARLLESQGIRRAEIVMAVRGFGFVHHVLALPRAPDELLNQIVDRELRRLEPQLGEAAVAWLPLPDEEVVAEAPPQRQLLACGAPRDVVGAFELGIRSAGHELLHLTALPAAVQRLHDEFESTTEPVAFVAPLPDGPFLGFFIGGALRLLVEPPLGDQDEPHDGAAMAEEVELGSMFVRQQFHGAQVARVTIAASSESFLDAEGPFNDRLGVKVGRLGVPELSAAGVAALGAILDSRSAFPLALAGKTRDRSRMRAESSLRLASYAALLIAALAGTFAVVQAFRARDAATSLQDARRRIEQESFGLGPMRETADRRKLIRDATSAMQIAARERRELQQALTAVATGAIEPVRLDSMTFDLGTNGWIVTLGGSIFGETSGRAVQQLNDFYRDLPRRLLVEALKLEQLTYADSSGTGDNGGLVHFQLSFIAPSAKRD